MKIIPSSRRHHYLARVSIFLVTVALITGMAGCALPSQNLEIRDWYDLDAIRDNLDGNHRLMNDLDATTAGYEELASPTANGGKGWRPIGSFDGGIVWFTGSFDGRGYGIRDLFVNRPGESHNVGLFCLVGDGGIIKNIRVMNATVTGGGSVGGLVGFNEGTVNDSYFSGNLTGNQRLGGLVGWNYGLVSNSYATGSVSGESKVGGLVGSNEGGTVSNSYYNCDEVLINGENMISIGALFGEDFDQWLANDKFLDINERLSQEDGYYAVNNVTDFKELLAFGQDASLKFRLRDDLDLATEPDFYVPYLAGEFDGNGHKVSNLSFNFHSVHSVGLFGWLASGAKVTGVGVENVNITGDEAVGGLVGHNRGIVSNSYSTGSVTGDSSVGGLAGVNFDGSVGNSYSMANVTGGAEVGGLLGITYYLGSVSDSYSTGNVTGEGSQVGGLVGFFYPPPPSNGSSYVSILSNSFWDTQTSGQATSAGGTGKTTAEMKDIVTFTDTETEGLDEPWDIAAVALGETNPGYIWNIVDDETYPFLSWQPVS